MKYLRTPPNASAQSRPCHNSVTPAKPAMAIQREEGRGIRQDIPMRSCAYPRCSAPRSQSCRATPLRAGGACACVCGRSRKRLQTRHAASALRGNEETSMPARFCASGAARWLKTAKGERPVQVVGWWWHGAAGVVEMVREKVGQLITAERIGEGGVAGRW